MEIATTQDDSSLEVLEKKPKGLHAKILEVMKEVGYIQKDVKVSFKSTNYKAISETKVTTVVRQSLIKHGLTLIPIHQIVSNRGNISQVEVTYRLTDAESGEYIDIASAGEGADSQDKGIGKASTYAYKYALLRTFAIATGEDPDVISSEELDYQDKQKHSELINEVGFVYQNLMQRGYDPMYLTNTAAATIGHPIQSFETLTRTELLNIKGIYQSL